MKEVKISGFTSDTRPDDKPAVCVFGENNTGRSRFLCTLPHDDGLIGYLALDKNAKRTVEKYREEWKLPILVNAKPFMTDKDSIALARLDSSVDAELKRIKDAYSDALNRLLDAAVALAEHKDVESIALDTGSQVFDWILFSHFGRRNQIESYQRGAPNQDMIDLINAMRTKNFAMASQASEIWKDTGEVDKKGNKKQAPSGKLKPDGFGKLGYFMTVVAELIAKRTGAKDDEDEEEALAKKYRIQIRSCKGRTLLEGQDLADYGVAGSAITWSNLMMAIGIEG